MFWGGEQMSSDASEQADEYTLFAHPDVCPRPNANPTLP